MSRTIVVVAGFFCLVAVAATVGGVFFLLPADQTAPIEVSATSDASTAATLSAKDRMKSPNSWTAAKQAVVAEVQGGPKGPVADAPEMEHDFGTMDPYQKGRHTFVIYNHGDAPLTLEKGASSCKCTFSELPENTIPANGTGRVTLEWETKKVLNDFMATSEVLTNDPNKRALLFRIEGKVRHQVRTLPENLQFGSLDPGVGASQSFLVYSQTWDAVSMENFACETQGIEWSTRDATPEELLAHDAKSGFNVDVNVSSKVPSGPLLARLTFDVGPADGSSSPQRCEVPIVGTITRRICLYGLVFDLYDGLNLGTIVQGEEKVWNGIVKLRGEPQTMEVLKIETLPADLQVTVEPYLDDAGAPKPGIYRFKMVLPSDATPCSYVKATGGAGFVKITTDHPLDPVLQFPVGITILPYQAK